jgi:hypothetical protein
MHNACEENRQVQTDTRDVRPNERHEPWCNVAMHEQDLALMGPIRCYSRTTSSGPVGGWLSANETLDGTVKVVLDWKAADWGSLTMAEASDLMVFLAQALAEYSKH